MANLGNNRYALFSSANENVAPKKRSTADVSQNPFLNQVADDSEPWEEVKKRGTPATQPAPTTGHRTLVITDRTKAVLNRPREDQSRNRVVSNPSIDSTEKSYDPYENWCGVCSQKFANKAALLSHIKLSTGHQHYCNLCKRIFKDRNGLKNHVDNAWDHEVHCNLCLSAFKDEWGLKNHFENNYSVGHEFVCLTCLLGFRSRTELDRHLQTAEKHTWCETCQRRFRNQDERDQHWETTIKHKHCLQPGCDFDGPDKAALALHHKRDHFQCEGCKLIMPSQTKLNLHYEKCSFTLLCPQCTEACAGRAQLALHLENCYLCTECGFHTHHEGNYHIHMTKHSSANIACWACDTPMRTYSGLINHLETGKCTRLSDPSLLLLALGRWWYSPLYMDLDIHAQLRTRRVDINQVQQWMNESILHSFVCRADGCGKTFAHLSSLVLHCESKACVWDIDRLNMPGLEKEFKKIFMRRDSGTA